MATNNAVYKHTIAATAGVAVSDQQKYGPPQLTYTDIAVGQVQFTGGPDTNAYGDQQMVAVRIGPAPSALSGTITVSRLSDTAGTPTPTPTATGGTPTPTATTTATPTPTPTETTSGTITSNTCTPKLDANGHTESYTVTITGTASGPVDTYVNLYGFPITCDSWSEPPQLPNTCWRTATEPSATTWTITKSDWYNQGDTPRTIAVGGKIYLDATIKCPAWT